MTHPPVVSNRPPADALDRSISGNPEPIDRGSRLKWMRAEDHGTWRIPTIRIVRSLVGIPQLTGCMGAPCFPR
jgi:hypothetical protein